MAREIASMVLTGFDRYEKALRPDRMGRLLRKHIALGTRRGALLVLREIRQGVKRGIPPKNAALTVAIKGSSKTLVDHGDLFQALAIDQPDWREAFIGIKKTEGVYNIAKTLHEGETIPVTDKMRGLFYVLWLASVAHKTGGGTIPLTGRAAQLFSRFKDWSPLKAETRAIKIPARPFIRNVFEDAAIKAAIIKKWEDAIAAAMRELAKGGA